MSKFIIHGGKKLKGTYTVSGAKNAAPKLLIASLLTKKKCVFHNIARISDTYRSLDALTSLGASIQFIKKNSVAIQCADIYSSEIPLESMSARQSVIFIGATLARTGHVVIYPPKGDATIGKRPINRHLAGIEALGGKIIKRGNNCLEIFMPRRPKSAVYTFEKNTHCGTENLILASVFNSGKIILKNAAEEPEVDNLIKCLNEMGAKIKRIEPRAIEIIGVKPFLNGVETTAIPDRLEAATALVLSVMTGGHIVVKNAVPALLNKFTSALGDMGVEISFKNNVARIKKINYPLKPTNITTEMHPGFVTDWQPLITLLLASMAKGESIIHERIFETRWRYLEELKKMGIKYSLFHPKNHGAEYYNFNDSEYLPGGTYGASVYGPVKLRPAEMSSHDVRAGIDMLLAGLVAPGKTIINDPQNHIDRGYENIVAKLTDLGADIKRI
ncbi:hypothetical protein A2917_00975 [Candidatus Nomurabacteria bacterium RIFCSPLOWO2_01_FULL_42_17]|uniref:UDP-N-acetylglucosamine 1-carboxyvinyltransferase n=1 Tax=Candidatus Nomurabacteria bacterium RIFCSPLOWO2_01_FULL_42_17 TaxID=1801780 RepID=A0A1F6XLZ4_9BACT|nr:MAG: hypothetical protein A2917_00975 [Candidatus Nomurabacteria bacterium RIFCSPLOWO2_01_FULL_42_17]